MCACVLVCVCVWLGVWMGACMCMCVLGTIYLFNAHFLYTEPTSAEIQVGTSLDLKALHMEVHHCTKQVEKLSRVH